MSYYNITISVDEESVAQKQFLDLLKRMCATDNAFSIKPMKTKIFTSDCLFFDDVNSPTYNEICKVADAGSCLEMNVTSVSRHDEYTDEINKVINEKCDDMIVAISRLMKGLPDDNENKETLTVDIQNTTNDEEETEALEETTSTNVNEEETANTGKDANNDDTTATLEEEPTEAYKPNDNTEDSAEDEYEPEDSDALLDDELSLDDSDPDYEPEEKAPKVPEGKLYPDNYGFLMAYKEFSEKSEKEKQDIIHSEVGWHTMADKPLEELKTWQTKEFHIYCEYLSKYPEMDKVDKPIHWLKSYTNYVLSEGVYAEYGNDRECFYGFDSFVRAKLNRDIKCEDMVKSRIDSLYK